MPKNTAQLFNSLSELNSSNINGYNDANQKVKNNFHRIGKAALKSLASDLGYRPQDYRLSSNKAGIAVSGEVVLHTANLYIQISGFSFENSTVLYRTCDHIKDYTGGRNNHCSIAHAIEEITSFSKRLSAA